MIDVVIVGAGPTGLLLATELALGGVRALVVERRTEPDLALKAGGIGPLAAEALERRGLGPALADEENKALAAVGTAKPLVGNFGGLFLIDQALQREPARRMRGVNQAALERILAAHAANVGVEVWRGSGVASFADHGDHVHVVLEDGRALEAKYLVGCDGARSVVRKNGGFDFPGTDPTLTGRQGIVEVDHPELLGKGWQRTPTGMMAYGPRPGRLSVIEFDGPPRDREAPVTLEEFEASLRRVSGADVRITALHSGTRYTDNARQTSTYRRGRVFLAGDAAHIHSPFGGQGLNLGLVDAQNLGWKLAAAIRNEAPPDLLDSYTAERHPVAAAVLENTRAQLALMRPDPQTSALRQIMADLLIGYPDVNRHFGEMISGVNTRYDLGDPQIGHVIADFAAEMHDGRWLLVNADANHARIRVITAPDVGPMLIRPDGCVAWAGRGEPSAALERWFA